MARLGKLFALLALFAACAHGFSGPVAARSTLSRAAVHMEVQRINKGIDLDSPKVVNQVDLDGKSVFCRCWQSKTFPLCDGAHVKHNEATGDNVGPLIVSVKKD